MEKVILHINEEAVSLELANLEQSKEQVESVRQYIIQKGFTPTATDIKSAVSKKFDGIVEQYKNIETKKIKKIIETFGDTAITDGWENKVAEKTKVFQQELESGALGVDYYVKYYLEYLDLDSEITIKPGYDKMFFTEKNSLVLKDVETISFYEKHCKACELLNELVNHPDNEFDALNKLFFFNQNSKEFELSVYPYDPLFEQNDLVQQRELEEEKIRKNEEYRRNNSLRR